PPTLPTSRPPHTPPTPATSPLSLHDALPIFLRLPPADTARYATEIKAAAERYGVPDRLVQAVIRVESGFNSRAVSVKGAQGLMQDRKSTRLNSSHGSISYAVFCLKKKMKYNS